MGLVYLLHIRSKDMSEFDDIIKKRKMIRLYIQDKPIPQQIVDKLITNAHRAPSAGHTQVQEFIIVQDPLIKKKLGEAALNQEQIYDAPLSIVVCANTSRSVNRYGKRGREFYSIIDGAFASMLILLTAVNEGIGACFVGAFLDEKVSEILELPVYVKPIGIIALGFPAEDPGKFKRIDISKLVHYEKYSNQKQK